MNESERRRGVFLDLNGTLVLPIHAENPREYRQIANSGEAVVRRARESVPKTFGA